MLYEDLNMDLLVVHQLFEARFGQVLQCDLCGTQIVAFDLSRRDSLNNLLVVLGGISNDAIQLLLAHIHGMKVNRYWSSVNCDIRDLAKRTGSFDGHVQGVAIGKTSGVERDVDTFAFGEIAADLDDVLLHRVDDLVRTAGRGYRLSLLGRFGTDDEADAMLKQSS